MGATIESSTTIARPVEEVFRFLLDLDKNPTDPGVESVIKTPDGPAGLGTTFRFIHAKGRETTMQFTAVEPRRRIEFQGKVGPLEPAGAFDFEHADGRTRLTVRVAPNPVGPLKLAAPVVNRTGQRIWDQRLARIKAALEAPTP
jgi:uncharacterized protein YndB with AHSA1/START domain